MLTPAAYASSTARASGVHLRDRALRLGAEAMQPDLAIGGERTRADER